MTAADLASQTADDRARSTAAGLASASDDNVEAMFEAWRAQEEHVDLSDLRWADTIVFAIFWLLFGVDFLQFFTRYVLNDSLGWTEEIARYLLVGVVFIGSVTAMRKGSHIAVEAVLLFLPLRLKHGILVAVDGVVALFCYGMAYYGWVLGERANQYMVSIDIPKSYMYWAVALAILGMAIHATVRFLQRLRRGPSADAPPLVID